MLDIQTTACDCFLACSSVGINIAINIAIMAITTKSSTNVNAFLLDIMLSLLSRRPNQHLLFGCECFPLLQSSTSILPLAAALTQAICQCFYKFFMSKRLVLGICLAIVRPINHLYGPPLFIIKTAKSFIASVSFSPQLGWGSIILRRWELRFVFLDVINSILQ